MRKTYGISQQMSLWKLIRGSKNPLRETTTMSYDSSGICFLTWRGVAFVGVRLDLGLGLGICWRW